MNEENSTIKKYNRIAGIFDRMNSGADKRLFSKWKKIYLPPLKGNILEVGIGTGKSIEFYNKEAKVTGIDFSKNMLQKAEEKLLQLDNKNITLKIMDVENLQFQDNSFDHVFTSCVFCSVPDPIKGLKEIRRVLKPSGKLIMNEHVLSKIKIIAIIEHMINPITKFLLGVNINRNTKQNIIEAGMQIIQDKKLALFDVFRLFEATK